MPVRVQDTKVRIGGEDTSGRAFKSARDQMRKTKSVSGRMTASIKKHWSSVKRNVTVAAGAFLAFTVAVGVAMRSFISAADVTENYEVRLQHLLGSVSEGTRLFEEMSEFASKVPFEYEQIMSAATQLSGVMEGGVDEVMEWIPLIGDLAAVSGLSIEKTTEQVIRMYSAGAGAADLFRERGILAMLGFQAGVKTSAIETREIMMREWKKTGSQFKGATDDLAKTWTGQMSMMSDAWFLFRVDVMDSGLFDFIKGGINVVLEKIDELKKTGDFKVWAKNLSDTIVTTFKKVVLGVAGILDLIGPILNKSWNAIKSMWDNFRKLPAWVQQVGIVGAIISGPKGAIVIGGIAHMIEVTKNTMEGFSQVLKGNIKFTELATMNYEELEATLNKLRPVFGDLADLPLELDVKMGPMQQKLFDLFKEIEALSEQPQEAGGPGDGVSIDDSAKLLATQSEIDKLSEMWEQYYLTDSERLDFWFQEQFLKHSENEESKLQLYQIYIARKKQLDDKAKADEDKLNALKVKAAQTTFSNMSQALFHFAQDSGKVNEGMFKAYKAFAMAEAIISTYAGAARALKDYPAPWSFAVAASIVAAGFARVDAISKQQPSASVTPSSASGTETFPVSPVAFPTVTTPAVAAEVAPIRVEKIVIITEAKNADEIAEELLPALRRADARGVH